MKYLITALLFFVSSLVQAENYPSNDSSCDGYPQAKVGTQGGTCLGIVLQAGDDVKWRKPRRIIQVPDIAARMLSVFGR